MPNLAPPTGPSPVFALQVSLGVAMLGLGVVGPLMPLYAKAMGAAGMGVGLVYSAYSLARAVSMAPLGRLSDRWGTRPLLLAGLAGQALASFSYAFVTQLPALVVLRFLHGLSSALVIPTAMAQAADSAPAGQEGRTMGRLNLALFLGFAGGPLVGGFAGERWGIPSVFIAMGVAGTAALALAWILLPLGPGRLAPRRPPRPWLGLLSDRRVLALLCLRGVNAAGRGMMVAFLAIFAVDRLGLGLDRIGLLMAINLGVMGLLQPSAGRLADRLPLWLPVAVGGLLTTLSLAVVPAATGSWGLLTAMLVGGLGGAATLPAATAYCARLGRDRGMGTLMGLFSAAMSWGMATGPLLGGATHDALGLVAVFWVGAGINLAGTLGFFALAADDLGRPKAAGGGASPDRPEEV